MDIEGAKEKVLEVGDGKVLIRSWGYHRLFPVLDPGEEIRDGNGDGGEGEDEEGQSERKGRRCAFLLSDQETGEQFRLDTVFSKNWYGYQDEIVMRGGKMDLSQVMCVSFLLF